MKLNPISTSSPLSSTVPANGFAAQTSLAAELKNAIEKNGDKIAKDVYGWVHDHVGAHYAKDKLDIRFDLYDYKGDIGNFAGKKILSYTIGFDDAGMDGAPISYTFHYGLNKDGSLEELAPRRLVGSTAFNEDLNKSPKANQTKTYLTW